MSIHCCLKNITINISEKARDTNSPESVAPETVIDPIELPLARLSVGLDVTDSVSVVIPPEDCLTV